MLMLMFTASLPLIGPRVPHYHLAMGNWLAGYSGRGHCHFRAVPPLRPESIQR
jgi:hypothetical protein